MPSPASYVFGLDILINLPVAGKMVRSTRSAVTDERSFPSSSAGVCPADWRDGYGTACDSESGASSPAIIHSRFNWGNPWVNVDLRHPRFSLFF